MIVNRRQIDKLLRLLLRPREARNKQRRTISRSVRRTLRNTARNIARLGRKGNPGIRVADCTRE